MVADHRDGSAVTAFRYYNVRGEPVRVVLDERGEPFGADSYDAATHRFERNAALISHVETDPHADEISASAFEALCAERRRAYVRE